MLRIHYGNPLFDPCLHYLPHKIPWCWHSLLVRCLVESQWFASTCWLNHVQNPQQDFGIKIPLKSQVDGMISHDASVFGAYRPCMEIVLFGASQYLIRPPWISLCLVAVFVHQNHLQQIGYPPWKMEKHGKTKTNPRCFMHGIFPYTKTSPNGPDVSWMFQHHGSHIPNDSTNEWLSSHNYPII